MNKLDVNVSDGAAFRCFDRTALGFVNQTSTRDILRCLMPACEIQGEVFGDVGNNSYLCTEEFLNRHLLVKVGAVFLSG